ncbi:MAG: hypothetical protein MR825_05015 [Lawsonibacter sp.]|nr:hypothetical protein [Lawsonibacter sp.]
MLCLNAAKKLFGTYGPYTVGGAFARRKCFHPKAKPLAEAEFISAEQFDHRRTERQKGAKLQKKDTRFAGRFLHVQKVYAGECR